MTYITTSLDEHMTVLFNLWRKKTLEVWCKCVKQRVVTTAYNFTITGYNFTGISEGMVEQGLACCLIIYLIDK